MTTSTPRDGYRARAASFLARVLGPKESREEANNVPPGWYTPQQSFGQDRAPFASGTGYVSSPFSSYTEKVWGVTPQADQARYRVMYRTVPIAHAAVDKLMESACAKGFGLDINHENPKSEQLLEIVQAWLDEHPEFLTDVLPSACKDLLIHGSCYVEPCYPETMVDVITPDDDDAAQKLPDLDELKASGTFSTFNVFHGAFSNDSPNEQTGIAKLYEEPMILATNADKTITLLSRGTQGKNKTPSELVWLKNLDFLTMRIRRDSWGNVYGAVQYISTPPVAFDTSKIIVGKWNPISTFYESAYGVSLFQSLLRTQEAIWQIENDLLVVGHAEAKPPMKFTRGTLDATTGRVTNQPSDPEWSSFQSRMLARNAGSDVFLPPNVPGEALTSSKESAINGLVKHLEYHAKQRIVGLRVPPQLLGIPEGSTRTTATVNAGDYILTVQTLQASLRSIIRRVFEFILAPHLDVLGDDYEVPEIVWNPIMEADETVELDKIVATFQAGLLTIAEARRTIDERGIFEVDDSPESLAELQQRNAPVAPMSGGDPLSESSKDQGAAGNPDVMNTPKTMTKAAARVWIRPSKRSR